MNIILNKDDLKESELKEQTSKVRAVLLDENENILVANYGGVLLLPGGSIDENETEEEALKRELKEELGIEYQKEELDFLATINHYQKNYPKRDNTYTNRLVITHYYIGNYKPINQENRQLTEKEQKGNFKLFLMSIKELINIIENNQTANPRNQYFNNELLEILKFLKKQNKV